MSTPSLALLVYEQAQKALEKQERQVSELRQRTGTLLAAATLTASFFGAGALARDAASAPVIVAGLALAVTVLSGLYALYPHRLDFAADARSVYAQLARDRDDPERALMRLAFLLRDGRALNGRVVDRLGRCLGLATLALVVQVLAWIWALVLVL